MDALIVGGGIAGPVTAMALQRAGVDARILESHPPDDGEVGSYFTVTANGLAALDAIDARGLAEAAGFPTRRNVLWNDTGRRLAALPLDSRLPGSPVARTMKRSRLARILRDEAVRRGIPVEHGRPVASAAVGPDGRAIAVLEDGGRAEADLLVGADGIHSVVRRSIDPSAPVGRYVGLTNFGGITSGAAADIEPEAWHLIFGRRAFFGYQATPAGDVVWFANVPEPMIPAERRAATSEAEWRRRLIELFRPDVGPAVDLIDGGRLELAADNTHDLGHVPVWHRGPLVVVGDAAHAPAPTSGQGASMAIEDAIVLARAIRDRGSIETALAEYERLRRDRVERIVAWGARGSSDKIPGRFGRLSRDVLMRLVFRFLVTEKSLGWMYDYRIDWHGPLRDAAERAA